jgi:hypothetical protein
MLDRTVAVDLMFVAIPNSTCFLSVSWWIFTKLLHQVIYEMASSGETVPFSERIVRRETAVQGGYIYLVTVAPGEKQYLRWENVPRAAQSQYLVQHPDAAVTDRRHRFLPAEHLKAPSARSRSAKNKGKQARRKRPRAKSAPRMRK